MRLIARMRARVLRRQRVDARAHPERDVEHLGDLGMLQPPAHVRGGELAQAPERIGGSALRAHVVDKGHQHGLHLQVLGVGAVLQRPGRAHGAMMAC
jgi:hypothetical protein